mmetsp:Transcript_9087/g.14378  ORF Transcript_9087/g.14378 Transcript_9087/m.14378 type:complete len:241 (+) Transcript_9087:525-1247(+)
MFFLFRKVINHKLFWTCHPIMGVPLSGELWTIAIPCCPSRVQKKRHTTNSRNVPSMIGSTPNVETLEWAISCTLGVTRNRDYIQACFPRKRTQKLTISTTNTHTSPKNRLGFTYIICYTSHQRLDIISNIFRNPSKQHAKLSCLCNIVVPPLERCQEVPCQSSYTLPVFRWRRLYRVAINSWKISCHLQFFCTIRYDRGGFTMWPNGTGLWWRRWRRRRRCTIQSRLWWRSDRRTCSPRP